MPRITPTLMTLLLIFNHRCSASDNNAAQTPPMGWSSRSLDYTTDCDQFPDKCLNEEVVKAMAHQINRNGYLRAGYKYFILDDGWAANSRDAQGRLQGDPYRFPNGMRSLVNDVHHQGLRFGLSINYGQYTNSQDRLLQLDAETFARWGVDYVQMDFTGNGDDSTIEDYIEEMSRHLNKTKRRILFSCVFPPYLNLQVNYSKAMECCNTWRTTWNIENGWFDVWDTAFWYSTHEDLLRPYHGPGGWNDPDLLVIGENGLTYDQGKAHMAIWAILAAPLIMSVDVVSLESEWRDLLLNKDAIRINQDGFGELGQLVARTEELMVWSKTLKGKRDSFEMALAVVRNGLDGSTGVYDLPFIDYMQVDADEYAIKDVFEKHSSLNEVFSRSDVLHIELPPIGGVLFLIKPIEYGYRN